MVEALKGWAFVPANHFNMSAVEVPAHLAGDEAAARMEWALKISLSTPALLGSVFSQCAIHVRCSWPDPQAEAMDALAQSWDDLIPYAFEESFLLGCCASPHWLRVGMIWFPMPLKNLSCWGVVPRRKQVDIAWFQSLRENTQNLWIQPPVAEIHLSPRLPVCCRVQSTWPHELWDSSSGTSPKLLEPGLTAALTMYLLWDSGMQWQTDCRPTARYMYAEVATVCRAR